MKLARASKQGTRSTLEIETPPIEIDEAGPGDYHSARAVLIMAYAEYQTVLPDPVFAAYIQDLVDLERRAKHSQLLIARRRGRAVGVVSFYPDACDQGVGWPEEGWGGVRALAVVPQARGLGVAEALMNACMDRARAADAPALALHTADFMEAASRFYRRLGFRRAPHFDFDVPDSAANNHPPVTARAYVRLMLP